MINDEQLKKGLFEFDRVETFEACWPGGIVRVWLKKKVGLYDIQEGRLVIPFEYDQITLDHPESNYRFVVYQDRKCGVYETTHDLPGLLVVPVEYDHVTQMAEEVYRVSNGGRHGVYSIAHRGLVIPIEFDSIDLLTSTLFLVKIKSGARWGLYSTEDKSVAWKS